MPSQPIPPRDPDPPCRPEGADAGEDRRAEVRRLTESELESMRREFKTSSVWMKAALAGGLDNHYSGDAPARQPDCAAELGLIPEVR